MPCYKSGGCGVYEMYSCSECPASKPSYLKPKEPKVTNEHAIRHLWTTEQLTHVLIERRTLDEIVAANTKEQPQSTEPV